MSAFTDWPAAPPNEEHEFGLETAGVCDPYMFTSYGLPLPLVKIHKGSPFLVATS